MFTLLLTLYMGCSKDSEKNDTVIGKWKLIQIQNEGILSDLSDEGIYIEFYADNTVSTNGSLCLLNNINYGSNTTGEYNPVDSILWGDCPAYGFFKNYQINNGILIIDLNCEVACLEFYEKD